MPSMKNYRSLPLDAVPLPLSEVPFSDPPPLNDFELRCVELQTERVQSFVSVAAACKVAVESSNVLTASKFFSQKPLWVKRRADVYSLICDVFGGEEAFLPQIPLSLYETAAKTNDPRHWLRMATDPSYRQEITREDDGLNVWSARHLADMAGLSEGKKVSDVPQVAAGTKADVVTWEVGHIGLDIEDFEPAGVTPRQVKFTGKLVEVLDKGDK